MDVERRYTRLGVVFPKGKVKSADYCNRHFSVGEKLRYQNCALYGLKSKRKLQELLRIVRRVYFKQSFVNSKISVYRTNERIIEMPDDDIKAIQNSILSYLNLIGIPDFMFSGIKGRSYIDLEAKHSVYRYSYCFDIQKFYYNTSRNSVYNFYRDTLNTSSDVAEALCNLSTVDLRAKNFCNDKVIISLINSAVIKPNHLIVGSPASPLLSFFANEKLFFELRKYSSERGLAFASYVDDLIFSSDNEIGDDVQTMILEILLKHGHSAQVGKTRMVDRQKNQTIFNRRG